MDEQLLKKKIKELGWWYCPVNFGNGIVAEDASTASLLDSNLFGIRKWNFIIRRNLPNLQGKRCLDLGCNNGLFCIQMAREGASEVIGVDKGEHQFFEQALFVKEALEWRCKTKYSVKYIKDNMLGILKKNLGNFDVVIILNCIYYLEKEDIRKLVQYLNSTCNTLLIQTNLSNVHPKKILERTSLRFLEQVLLEAGFKHIRKDTPKNYSQPIIVGINRLEGKTNYAVPHKKD